MEWSIFAVLQMFIITVGVSLAMWLRIRAVNQQNTLLREHLAGAEAASEAALNNAATAPEEWLQAQLAELAADDPTAPVRRLVLEETLNPTDDFDQRLTQAIAAAGLTSSAEADGDLQAQITSLETELAAAREGQNTDHAEELKSLLQQFTRDSREMMACIQTLEAENAELRTLLGDDAPPVKTPPAGAEPETETVESDASSDDHNDQELLTPDAPTTSEDVTTETAA